MKLAKNFTLEEFTCAGSARKVGDIEQFNLPPSLINNARNLCVHCLQPIRDYINAVYIEGLSPVEIKIQLLSGFRSQKVNDFVKGSKKSYHLRAMAADIVCYYDGKLHNDFILDAIKILQIPFTEVILEYGTIKNPLWVHIALDENNICHAIKRAFFEKNKKVIRHLSDL